MTSWYTIRARNSGTEVLIYDEIGAFGISAKGFLTELSALPDDTAIDLRLNSPGGSVFDAVAIYNAMKRHVGEITVWIDGIAASAASYIAMAADKIIMPENAFLMIHDPSGMVMGTADDMRDMAAALDKVKTSLIQGYGAKSNQSDADIATLMAAETWFDAKDAMDLGLIDQIAAPVHMAASFDVTRFKNAPPEMIKAVTVAAPDPEQAGKLEELLPGVPNASAQPSVGALTAEAPPAAVNDAPPPDATAIRADTIAHARAVIDLCRLADQPQMAGRFLEEDADLDEVRRRLLAAKADATPDTVSNAHAQPGWADAANPWGDVIARTFKTKG